MRGSRDPLAVAIELRGQLVDQRLRDVRDERVPAGHVAVERAVADGDLGLVARREHEVPEPVRERHQDRAADAGLQVLLGQRGSALAEGRAAASSGTRRRPGRSGSTSKRIPSRSRQRLGVAEASFRGVGARHRDRRGRARGRAPRRRAPPSRPSRSRRRARARRVWNPHFGGVVLEGQHERAAQPGDRGIVGRRRRAAAARQVDRPEILLEAPAGADEPPARVERRRRAVENEAVVAADEVAVDQRHARCGARSAPSCAPAAGSCRACTARRRC